MRNSVLKRFAAIPILSLLVLAFTRISSGQATETVLYTFGGQANDGANANGGLLFDAAGNIYGTTAGGGLTKYTLLFSGQNAGNPESGVLIDEKTGDLFGTTYWGNNVYMVKGKTESTVYQFCSLQNCADGSVPGGGLLVARDGQLYGVTESGGGPNNDGVVYQISPQ